MEKVNDITIWSIQEFSMSRSEYWEAIAALLVQAYEYDKTVIPREASYLEGYHDHAVIAVNGKQDIIWHWACFPAKTFPAKISLHQLAYTVGENGSIVIHPHMQWKKIWTHLAQYMQRLVDTNFDIVAWWTISPAMLAIRKKLGYIETSFPKKLFEEGKAFFWPIIWEHEFAKRATCNVRIPEHLWQYKDKIIDLLLQEKVCQ